MTLIAEFHQPGIGSIFLTDCLATDPKDRSKRRSEFPLHIGCDWDLDTRGSYAVSKLLTGSNSFIAGSGFTDRIQSVAETFLKEHADNFELSEFQNYLDDYYLDREKTESYLYGARIGAATGSSDSYCQSFDIGHIQVRYGGTGGDYLRQLLEGGLTPDPKMTLLTVVADVLSMLIRKEFSEHDFLDKYFGGSYELLMIDEAGIQRIPYSVLELGGDSTLADDGIYEIDISTISVTRHIFAVPFASGTHFASVYHDGNSPQIQVSSVFELLKPRPPNLNNLGDLSKILEGYKPAFNVLLLRYSQVNSFTSHNLVDFQCTDTRWSVGVDSQELEKVLRLMFQRIAEGKQI